MDLDNQELQVTRNLDCILNVSKALKCKTCGKYIVSEDELHKYNTCSDKCYRKQYYIILRGKKDGRY